VKNFQSCRLVLAGFAILACTAAQSPCGGEPRDLIAASTIRRNGLGVASVIPSQASRPRSWGTRRWPTRSGSKASAADQRRRPLRLLRILPTPRTCSTPVFSS